MNESVSTSAVRGSGEPLAQGLGWFSLALGVPQVVAPRVFSRLIGARSEGAKLPVRLVGIRELAAGAGILTQARPAGFIWSRLAGDAMDVGLLLAAMRSSEARRGRLAAATAAVAGVAVLDAISARRSSRQAQDQARRHIRAAVTVAKPPHDVYALWHDVEDLPSFMPHLQLVERQDGESHWTTSGPLGQKVEWDAEIVEDRQDELISWRSLPGSDVESSGSVRFAEAPGGRGTEVIVDLEYVQPAAALGHAVASLSGRGAEQQVRDALRRFKQVAETGEVVRSEGSPQGADASQQLPQHKAQPPLAA